MGHTHNQYPEKPGPRDRIFYPSTPDLMALTAKTREKPGFLNWKGIGTLWPNP
jgi:hypothetical protein